MLQNLKDITKSAPPIRVGGTTANHGIYIADQEEAMIQNFAVAGADQPANVTWGPAFLESFKIFPKGTKYTVGVTFDSGSTGEKATVTEAEAFYKGIGKELFAMEVGNEFDGTYIQLTSPIRPQLTLRSTSLPHRPRKHHMEHRHIRLSMAQSHDRHRR